MGTYSAIMVTNLTEAEVDGRHLTENWVGVLGIVSSLVSTAASLISGREEASWQLVHKKIYEFPNMIRIHLIQEHWLEFCFLQICQIPRQVHLLYRFGNSKIFLGHWSSYVKRVYFFSGLSEWLQSKYCSFLGYSLAMTVLVAIIPSTLQYVQIYSE